MAPTIWSYTRRPPRRRVGYNPLMRVSSLLAFAFLLAAFQEKSRCDLKTTEKGRYCAGCASILEKKDLRANGDRVRCGKASESAEICVKEYWQCSRCKKCARKNEKFMCKHASCKAGGKDAVRMCDQSGNFPHSKD